MLEEGKNQLTRPISKISLLEMQLMQNKEGIYTNENLVLIKMLMIAIISVDLNL